MRPARTRVVGPCLSSLRNRWLAEPILQLRGEGEGRETVMWFLARLACDKRLLVTIVECRIVAFAESNDAYEMAVS